VVKKMMEMPKSITKVAMEIKECWIWNIFYKNKNFKQLLMNVLKSKMIKN
jgi:hypothetical protein